MKCRHSLLFHFKRIISHIPKTSRCIYQLHTFIFTLHCTYFLVCKMVFFHGYLQQECRIFRQFIPAVYRSKTLHSTHSHEQLQPSALHPPTHPPETTWNTASPRRYAHDTSSVVSTAVASVRVLSCSHKRRIGLIMNCECLRTRDKKQSLPFVKQKCRRKCSLYAVLARVRVRTGYKIKAHTELKCTQEDKSK